MTRLRKVLATAALAALTGAGAIVASTAPASAYVLCNRWGHCWRTWRPNPYWSAYYGPYYDDDYGPYYGPYYYGPGYYGAYGPSLSLGFTFGGGHHWHGGWHRGGRHRH